MTEQVVHRRESRHNFDSPQAGRRLSKTEVERRLGGLQDQMAAFPNQPVLLVTRSWQLIEYGWTPWSQHYLHEDFYMGIPQDPKLDIELGEDRKARIVVPTTEYAHVFPDTDRFTGFRRGIGRGKIAPEDALKIDLDKPTLSTYQRGKIEVGRKTALEIVVGRKNIREWAKQITPKYNRTFELDMLTDGIKIDPLTPRPRRARQQSL